MFKGNCKAVVTLVANWLLVGKTFKIKPIKFILIVKCKPIKFILIVKCKVFSKIR
jgi:hypothetical protein